MNKLFAVVSGLMVLVAGGRAPKSGVAAERAALLEADLAWSKAGAAKELERFCSYVAQDGAMLPPNAPIVAGKEAIRGMISELYSQPGFAINFQASEAEVSRAGDLGYTIGAYELTHDDPAGNATTDRGKYVTIWKKQEGQWRVVVDIWNSDLPAPALPAP